MHGHRIHESKNKKENHLCISVYFNTNVGMKTTSRNHSAQSNWGTHYEKPKATY